VLASVRLPYRRFDVFDPDGFGDDAKQVLHPDCELNMEVEATKTPSARERSEAPGFAICNTSTPDVSYADIEDCARM
jgi:hypothetical protein